MSGDVEHINFLCGRIWQLHEQHWPVRAIADEVDLYYVRVWRIIKRIQETGHWKRSPGQGRPRKTSDRVDRFIIREVKKNPFSTSQEIAAKIPGRPLSDRSVRQRIGETSQFKSRFAPRFHSLTQSKPISA